MAAARYYSHMLRRLQHTPDDIDTMTNIELDAMPLRYYEPQSAMK